jgi:hypothetical protein
MEKVNNLYNILYNKVWMRMLGDNMRRRRLKILCVFIFGCVCGFCNKFYDKMLGKMDINKKLELLDEKRNELVELHKNLESIRGMLNEMRNELEEKKKC